MRNPYPCSFAQLPTYGDCDGVLLWHVDEGSYGDARLDGLNVAMLASFTGNVWIGEHTDPFAAVFIDERADETQRAALQTIFGGEAGAGRPSLGRCSTGRCAEWRSRLSRSRSTMTWPRGAAHPGPRRGHGRGAERPTSTEGVRVQVHNLPGSETGPGQGPATWGRATLDRADAYGFQWDRSGYSSKLIPFDWTGPDGE